MPSEDVFSLGVRHQHIVFVGELTKEVVCPETQSYDPYDGPLSVPVIVERGKDVSDIAVWIHRLEGERLSRAGTRGESGTVEGPRYRLQRTTRFYVLSRRGLVCLCRYYHGCGVLCRPGGEEFAVDADEEGEVQDGGEQ